MRDIKKHYYEEVILFNISWIKLLMWQTDIKETQYNPPNVICYLRPNTYPGEKNKNYESLLLTVSFWV